MRNSVLIALRVLSRVAENLKMVEKKIDDHDRILLGTIDSIETRIKQVQEAIGAKWYEIDDEDRIAAQVSGRSNMEF